jgi:hypothetical protein
MAAVLAEGDGDSVGSGCTGGSAVVVSGGAVTALAVVTEGDGDSVGSGCTGGSAAAVVFGSTWFTQP